MRLRKTLTVSLMPSKPFTRFKLLFDEGFFSRKELKRVNSKHNVKHIKMDYGMEGLEDSEVYKRACKERRIIVVFNRKHFRKLVSKNDRSGVIGVSSNLTHEEIDKKLSSLLNKSKEKDLYGTYTSITKSGTRTVK